METKKQFIDILNKEKYPYEINDDNKIIIGGNIINSKLITYIPDNVVFNNNGYVFLYYLKELGNNVIFNNKDFISLESIFYFDIFSVNFTNNVTDVYFGNEIFWMKDFPYEFYPNIKGKFKMKNKEGNYEIIK